MFLLSFLLLGLAIGAVRGGSMRRLAGLQFRHGWLIFLGLFLQLVAFNDLLPADFWAPVVHILSYMAVVAGIALNFHLPPLRLLGLGALVNLAAIGANGGYMPVSPNALRWAGMEAELAYLSSNPGLANSALLHEGTRLALLTDIFALPAGIPLANVFSAGDILIGLGAMLLAAQAMGKRGDPEPSSGAGDCLPDRQSARPT